MNYGIIVIKVIKHYVQECKWHDLLIVCSKTLYYILCDISCLLYFYPIQSIKYLFWNRFQFHIQSADAFNPLYGKCLFHWTECIAFILQWVSTGWMAKKKQVNLVSIIPKWSLIAISLLHLLLPVEQFFLCVH